MGTLSIHFLGVNTYVPHPDGDAMMVVMPNGTHLGSSPTEAPDGTKLARHWPVIWEQKTLGSVTKAITRPRPFHGDRLSFHVKPAPPSRSRGMLPAIAAKDDWLDIDPATLSSSPDDRVAAQAVIHGGRVSFRKEPGTGCNKQWASSWDLSQHVLGVSITYHNVKQLEVQRSSLISVNHIDNVLHRCKIPLRGQVDVFVGNLCAESILGWSGNAEAQASTAAANQWRVTDNDFKWIYRLSKSPEVDRILKRGDPLPAPSVSGSTYDEETKPFLAFGQIHGGGGAAGCQCGGKICTKKPFDK